MPSFANDDGDDASFDDPRISTDFLRTSPGEGDEGEVVLVGVVHDHPASIYRVVEVTNRVDPDVLALELPDLAIPQFERLARERGAGDSVAPDEMSAAIGAGDTDRVVGIDTLGAPFVVRFLERAWRERASISTFRRAVSATLGVARHAVACRIAVYRSARTSAPWTPHPPIEQQPEAVDPPDEQAADERSRVASSRALLGATERPHAERLIDDVRERTMAAKLRTLRTEGTVLGVVGMDHVDAVSDRLRRAHDEDPHRPGTS